MTRSFLFAIGAAALLTASPARADDPAGPAGEVTTVSVVPTPGEAQILIAVRGSVDVKDFVLREPDRLVIDILGARLNPGAAYDGVLRGGITDIRYAQFRPDVVRIAIYLDRSRTYRVEQLDDAIQVSFGTDQSFLAWSSASPALLQPPPAPARQPEVVAPRVTAAAAPAQGQQATRITVTWDRANIADVVAGFAAFSGRTIIIGKEVKGEVTAEIKNQPWTEAFAAVLATQGLQAVELPGGIIRVDSPTALSALDSTEPLTTRMVPVNYASAGQLVGSLKSVLTKRGNVVADTTTNALIITETRSRIDEVSEFVKSLDIRTPQISIQAKIIFVDRTNIEAMGIKYDFGAVNQGEGPFFNRLFQRTDPGSGEPFDRTVTDLTGEGVAAMANASSIITGSALDLVWTTSVGGFRYTAFIEALQQVDLADVQAEPAITTVDNREAYIKVGEDVPVRVVDFASSGAASAPTATVQFKETGISLKVTPHVTNSRQILMQLEAERSDLKILPAADLGYTIRKQNAKNQLLVNDGETAVIGGLTVTEVIKGKSGIPFLVDLPIVGKLFGYHNSQESRRDLIILVTPRIIDDGSGTE
ncbi:MAG: AMIN domain-containing protein [Gemmatimonadota bacterium]|nr:AMIN domain-containing protein [Gemmatimonadota bacterium]